MENKPNLIQQSMHTPIKEMHYSTKLTQKTKARSSRLGNGKDGKENGKEKDT